MSQFDFGTMNPDLQSGTQLASDMNSWRDALHSMHRGSSRPSYIVAGMMWIDDTDNPWLIKMYNGATLGTDSTLGSYVPATGVVTLYILDSQVTNAKLNADVFSTDREWSGSQRGAVVTDNDGSFDMNAGQNFSCTPAGSGTLTFTNITAGQSGFIYLSNTTAYTISKAATVKCGASLLSTISATGNYLLNYFSPDGTNVYVTASGALS